MARKIRKFLKNNNIINADSKISPEEMILRCRENDQICWDYIVSFYKPKARRYAMLVQPSLSSLISDDELEHVFFIALENTIFSYRGGTKRFESYFLTIFKNEMINYVKNCGLFEAKRLSLDSVIPGNDGSVMTFHDVIPSSDDREDPRLLLSLTEEALNLGKLEGKIDPFTLKIARMKIDGMTYREIADELNLTIKQVRYRIDRYNRTVSTIFAPHKR